MWAVNTAQERGLSRTVKKLNYTFSVPDNKRIRMIVCTDCKNEADDQFALAHHLMTPMFQMKGIIAGHFNLMPRQYGDGHTAQASLDEVNKVLDLMDLTGVCPVCKGAEYPMPDENTPSPSEGADRIIKEALKEDPHPLYVACQGALTDIASALLLCPEIAHRLTIIWIGGAAYPEGGEEFNLRQDIAAANVVMKSEAPLWQVPSNVYKKVTVSLAELQLKVQPMGKIGNYLYQQMVDFNNTFYQFSEWPHGEIWGLGDSPTVGILLAEVQRRDMYEEIMAPIISYEDMTYEFNGQNRMIRVYKDPNAELTLRDFFAKLQLNYGDIDR